MGHIRENSEELMFPASHANFRASRERKKCTQNFHFMHECRKKKEENRE